MHRTATMVVLGLALAFAATGCRSHRAQVVDLQKQYNQRAKQFQRDCSGEYLAVPPKISSKCKDEETKMNEAWSRLQAARTKK